MLSKPMSSRAKEGTKNNSMGKRNGAGRSNTHPADGLKHINLRGASARPTGNAVRDTVPYAFAIVAMIWWTRHSDATHERVWHVSGPAIVGSLSLIAAVASLTQPMAYGPTKPPRLPIEQINAMPPAAAEPVRNAVGRVQKMGNAA
jgi:hypothetical protein